MSDAGVSDELSSPEEGQEGKGAPELSGSEIALKVAQVILLLFIFLVGIRGLGTGFKGLGKDLLQSFFTATNNPFVALVVGILGTTLVQSSSVTTSMVVALVAAPDNPLPVQNAIPMIMGANIGTTVTNTVVSLGHVSRSDEFKRAFAAATCHDFFNFMTVAVLLPLELMTGFLSKASGVLARAMAGGAGGSKLPNPIKAATKGALKPLQSALSFIESPKGQAVGLILLSAAIIFLALYFIVKLLRVVAATRMKGMIERSLGRNAYVGMLVGAVVTVMVQSSSITTSVLVPLAAAGLVTLQQVFPITLGANIGTTMTAMLATTAADSSTAHLALQIAGVHLLFNIAGILMIYPWPKIRAIPLAAAEKLAEIATNSKRMALLYVVFLFYGLPALLIFVTRSL